MFKLAMWLELNKMLYFDFCKQCHIFSMFTTALIDRQAWPQIGGGRHAGL